MWRMTGKTLLKQLIYEIERRKESEGEERRVETLLKRQRKENRNEEWRKRKIRH